MLDRAANRGMALSVEPLRVEFLSGLDEMRALRQRWETLNGTLSDHDAPFFQSWAWCLHVATVRVSRAGTRYRPLVALVWEDRELIGIWPLSLQRMSGASVARMLDDPFGQFAGVAFKTPSSLTPGVLAVIRALRSGRVCDGLLVENVIEGSGLYAALASAGAHRHFGNEAVYVDLDQCTTIESFRHDLNKKTLKNLRNLSNRLQRVLATEHLTISQRNDALGRIMTWTFDGRVEWMQSRARTSPAFREQEFRMLLDTLSSSEVSLLAFSLQGGSTMVAAQWGFTYLRKYYAYMSARNPSFDEFSPGRMHLGMVIESCLGQGLKGLELMAPPSGYKLDWTRLTKRVDRFSMPFNPRGYLAIDILANRLEPLLRRASRRLPHAIRQPLIGMINRR